MFRKIARSLLVGGLALTFTLAPAKGLCGDDPDIEFSGKAAAGAHISSVTDGIVKVREFDLGREDLQTHLWFDMFGRSSANRVDASMWYYDEETMKLRFKIDAGPYLSSRTDIRSFHHWLDHDLLTNLQWREKVGDNPGGKMTTFEDTDPTAVYGIRYSEALHGIDVKAPFMPATRISAEYRDQRRTGEKQYRTVEHCSNCHVRAHTREVDEETRDLRIAFNTQVSQVNIEYEFMARRYENNAGEQFNYYMEARHPVNGGSVDEFRSRQIYADTTLGFSRAPDMKKDAHSVRVKADLPASQSLGASYSYSLTENQVEGLEMKTHGGGATWYAPVSKKMRLSASAMGRKIEADQVAIDLDPWREGRLGGGQDFDWTRMSVYDRREILGNVSATYAARPGHNLRFQYRFRSTDRDNLVLDPDDLDATTTMQNKIKASWSGRLARKANARASVEYELTDQPFVNVGGLCEHAIGDTVNPLPPGQPNDWIYYFQRSRYGTGGNLPSNAIRAKANLSYSLSPKASLMGYVSIASEKNDDLNIYEWERTALSPGASLYLIPSPEVVLAGGVAYSKIESNANYCATVMDG